MAITRSQAGKALKNPKRLIEEIPNTKFVTKKSAVKNSAVMKSAIKKSAIKRSAIKKSAIKKSAIKKSAMKKPATKKKSAATKKKAFEEAIGPEKKLPNKRVPARIIYEVTGKNGKKRTKYLEFPVEEIDQFNCPCEPDTFDSKGLNEFIRKKLTKKGIRPRGDCKARKP